MRCVSNKIGSSLRKADIIIRPLAIPDSMIIPRVDEEGIRGEKNWGAAQGERRCLSVEAGLAGTAVSGTAALSWLQFPSDTRCNGSKM